MSDPILGELKLFAFDWVPAGWASCDGQLLPIMDNQALFSIMGTTWGGDGHTTFALPDLRDRTPRHTSSDLAEGTKGGVAEHYLSAAELPAHTHGLQASAATATDEKPGGKLPAAGPDDAFAPVGGAQVAMQGGRVESAGDGGPHENRQPFATLRYGIAMHGVYPTTGGSNTGATPQPYVGEVRMSAGNFEPVGFRFCNGQLLPISEYPELFQVIGTTFGGNGTTHFALPDLRGRIPLHAGDQQFGSSAGQEQVALTSSQLPTHRHDLVAHDGRGVDTSPVDRAPATSRGATYAAAGVPAGQGADSTVTGGAQPHENMAPSLAITFLIATYGNFPTPA